MAILGYNGLETLEVGAVAWPSIFNFNISEIDEKLIARGTLAGRPAFGNVGRLFFATDVEILFYDSGTDWIVIASNAPTTVEGFELTYVSTTTVSIQPGKALDSTGDKTFITVAPLNANITVSGAGGLDTGVEAADTWYAVFIIGDTSGVSQDDALLSISPTAPTLPVGYDVFRRVGWVRNNSSSNFIEFVQSLDGRNRSYEYSENPANLIVLTGGTAVPFVAVDLSPFVPSTARQVYLQYLFDNSGGAVTADQFSLRVTGTGVTARPVFRPGVILGDPARGMLLMNIASNLSIDYGVTNAARDSLDLSVMGFTDEI